MPEPPPTPAPDPLAPADPVPTLLLYLALPAVAESIGRVAEAVGKLAASEGWPPGFRFHVDLVLEELVQNIISYGFPEGDPGTFELWIQRVGPNLEICLMDDGVAFDPLQLPSPDLEAPLAERSVGGLGVHLARTLMDGISYRRGGARNQIRLYKALPLDPGADRRA